MDIASGGQARRGALRRGLGIRIRPAGARWLRRAAPSVGILLLLLLAFLAGPELWPEDPAGQDLAGRLRGPSVAHPLGTDQLGRDVLARVLHGGRLSLAIAGAVTVASAAAGVAVGMAAAAPWALLRLAGRRAIELVLAFPWLLLSLTIAGLLGGGPVAVGAALAAVGWVPFARVVESGIVSLRGQPFVTAAAAVGAGPLRVYCCHLLPNLLPQVAVLAVVRYAHVILAIGTLSFLGVGVQPPRPEWGAMLQDAMPYFYRAPHLLLAPFGATLVVSLALAAVGEQLRRSLDPRMR